jgi:hypothetical protein
MSFICQKIFFLFLLTVIRFVKVNVFYFALKLLLLFFINNSNQFIPVCYSSASSILFSSDCIKASRNLVRLILRIRISR